jgi:hypothetical protein
VKCDQSRDVRAVVIPGGRRQRNEHQVVPLPHRRIAEQRAIEGGDFDMGEHRAAPEHARSSWSHECIVARCRQDAATFLLGRTRALVRLLSWRSLWIIRFRG